MATPRPAMQQEIDDLARTLCCMAGYDDPDFVPGTSTCGDPIWMFYRDTAADLLNLYYSFKRRGVR